MATTKQSFPGIKYASKSVLVFFSVHNDGDIVSKADCICWLLFFPVMNVDVFQPKSWPHVHPQGPHALKKKIPGSTLQEM